MALFVFELLLGIFAEFHEVLIGTLSVDAAFGSDFDDTVRSCLEDFVVMRSENHNSLEVYKAVIDCGNAFEVEVVCWTVKNQHV